MTFWSAMVAIVAILAFTFARVAQHRSGSGDPERLRHRSPPQGRAPRELELEKEVDDLRQRIAVLERIATEDRHSKSIAQEIESLRGS
jgi:hypothetical protein